jgi:hypothetical protein
MRERTDAQAAVALRNERVERAAAEAQLSQVRAERDAAEAQISQARAERDAILASTSWRVSAPFRAIKGRLLMK